MEFVKNMCLVEILVNLGQKWGRIKKNCRLSNNIMKIRDIIGLRKFII